MGSICSNRAFGSITAAGRIWPAGIVSIALAMAAVAVPSAAWCAGGTNLWVASYSTAEIQQYSASQLKKSGNPVPLKLTVPDFTTGIAFDKKSNLWALIYDDVSKKYELVEFSKAQLKALKSMPDPIPVVVITSDAFGEPGGINFDKQGNLWIVDEGNFLFKFSVAQLSGGSGNDTPAVTISSPDFDDPYFVVFDKSGSAWVDNYDSDTVVKFTLGQLTSSGSPGAAVVIGSSDFDGPGEIAFDQKGNLWVPNYQGDTVLMFTKMQIASSGSPAPTVILTKDINDSLDHPWGIAFLGANLAVVNYDTGTISKYASSQLKTSGSPTPKVFLNQSTGAASDNSQVTAGPSS
ncbi:MAG TPA: hypothetical protein VMU16_02730 [Candidatus Binataceae bacterium]|nr:hypothetical protein [Candidatus Binataceae bacterium]